MMRRFPPLFWSVLVLLGGLGLAWYMTGIIRSEQSEQARARFSDLAHRASDQVIQRMRVYEYGLRGMRGAIVAMGPTGTTRARVLNYSQSRNYDKEFPGARGYGFIRRVPVADEADFLQLARKDGKPDFTIRQLAPHAHERLIIQYIEPEDRNHGAVGLDIASENNLKRAEIFER